MRVASAFRTIRTFYADWRYWWFLRWGMPDRLYGPTMRVKKLWYYDLRYSLWRCVIRYNAMTMWRAGMKYLRTR